MASLTDRIALAPKPLFFVIGSALALVMFLSSGGGDSANYDSQIQTTKAELSKKVEILKKTKERVNQRAQFEEEMNLVSQTFRQALDYLPTKADTQDIYKKVYSEARAAGVEMSNFKPRDFVAKDFYDEIGMEIAVRGTYAQLTSFLANISKISRIINIKNVELKNPKYTDGTTFVDMKGVLVAYRYNKEGK